MCTVVNMAIVFVTLPTCAQTTGSDAYHTALLQDIGSKYHLSGGVEVIGQTEDAVAQAFHIIGPNAQGGTINTLPVSGQPFTKAVQANVTHVDGVWWHVMLQAVNAKPIRKGDALVASFFVRGRVPQQGGSEGEYEVHLKSALGPDYPEFVVFHATAGDNWQHLYVPVIAPRDCAPGEFQIAMPVGYKVQQVEFGGLSVIDYGPTAALAQLPHPEAQAFPYPGQSPDAQWRKDALARIEKIRKGPLAIHVVDASGRPVRGATNESPCGKTAGYPRRTYRSNSRSCSGAAWPPWPAT